MEKTTNPQPFLSTSYIKGKECLQFTFQEALRICNCPGVLQEEFVNAFQELCFCHQNMWNKKKAWCLNLSFHWNVITSMFKHSSFTNFNVCKAFWPEHPYWEGWQGVRTREGVTEKIQTLTRTRQVSTNENVPERPIPALQWTTAGPCSGLSEPDSLTLKRKFRNEAGDSGTPKSGHVV